MGIYKIPNLVQFTSGVINHISGTVSEPFGHLVLEEKPAVEEPCHMTITTRYRKLSSMPSMIVYYATHILPRAKAYIAIELFQYQHQASSL